MRRWGAWFMALILMVMVGAVPAQAADNGVAVNGKALSLDVEPAVVDGVLVVPVRSVAESLGGKVTWNQETQTATVQSDNTTVVFTVGKSEAVVDGQPVPLTGPVVLKDNRTMVPASFLLTLYGDHLAITNPGLKDPVAMALLEKSQKASETLKNFDIQMSLQMSMRIVDVVPMTIKADATANSHHRGEEMLLTENVKTSMVPALPGMPTDVQTIQMARRNGKDYMMVEGAWEVLPSDVDPAEFDDPTAQSLEMTQMALQMVKEAHLGAVRTVNGQQQQDVVITFDPKAMEDLTNEILGVQEPADPANQVSIAWENLTATFTFDVATGMAVRVVCDMAFNMTGTEQGKPMSMNAAMHMDLTQTINDKPIAWPADMPQ